VKLGLRRTLAVLLSAVPLYIACGAETDPPRGGVVVTILNDGSLDVDSLKVEVSKDDVVLMKNAFTLPQTPLPNTVSIVSNGTSTATATITISAWKKGAPVDRRDRIITQIPSDRVAALNVFLSARCTPLVQLAEDRSARSLCKQGETCDPETGTCGSARIDASSLPTYDPATRPGIANAPAAKDGGVDARPPEAGPDATASEAGPAPECERDEDCAAPLEKATPKGCAAGTCDPATRRCVYAAIDKDGDGFRPKSCAAPGITIETGPDCDDADNAVHPGAYDGPEDVDDPTRKPSCEGKDNDCNDKIDDGKTTAGLACTCAPTTTRECAATADGTPVTFPGGAPAAGSICKRGTQTCGANGQWGACAGAVGPAARDCGSANDNDCDGTPDNTVDTLCTCALGTTRACFAYPPPAKAGFGPCTEGSQSCVADTTGKGSVWGACAGGTGPQGPDSCSVQDNDNNCDGQKNSGCPCVTGQTQSCAGAECGTGTQTCTDGTWGACTNISADTASCPGTQCGTGTKTCNGGVWGACTGATQASRSCNGAQCGTGTQACTNGTWGTCSNISRPTQSCSSGCGTGTQTCSGGTWGTCGSISGPAVSCSGSTCGTGTRACTSNGTYGACSNITGSRACASGCGTQTCTNNGTTWSGACGTKACPGGTFESGGACYAWFVTQPVSAYLSDSGGGDGAWLASLTLNTMGLPAGASLAETKAVISYSSGGCYSSGTLDGVKIRCDNGYDRWLTQCESGSPSCGGSTWTDIAPNQHCDFGKVKGWTPLGQGTCVRRAEMTGTYLYVWGSPVCQ
jgi:hypothetical protein